MSTFNNFVSTIRTNSIALQSHYIVDIKPPPFMVSDTATIEMLPFYCEGINLPEQQVATRPVNDYGITREVAYEPLFGSVTATFFSDSSMTIKSFFDSWVGAISMGRNGRLLYPDAYKASDFSILCLDRNKNITHVVILKDAYPKIVDDISMAANSTAPVSFRVQFVYESWESINMSIFDDLVPQYNQVAYPLQSFPDHVNIPSNRIVTDGNGIPSSINNSTNNGTLPNLRSVMSVIQLIRSGANKDSIKSMIINAGIRGLANLDIKRNIIDNVSQAADAIIGRTGIPQVINAVRGIVL